MSDGSTLIDMSSLLTGIVGSVVTAGILFFAARFFGIFKRKIPIIWQEIYSFPYVNEVSFDVHRATVTAYFSKFELQNLTSRKLENIELIFSGNPDNYLVEPNRKTESTVNANGLVLSFDSIAPKERFSVTLENESNSYLTLVKCDGVAMEKLYQSRIFPRDWFILPFGASGLFNLLIYLSIFLMIVVLGLIFVATKIS